MKTEDELSLALDCNILIAKTNMETLNEIGLRHQTDKSSMTHCYLDNYERYFSSWRDKEFVLLEIGVAGGASIAMWREYFQNAKVYGIDNNPDTKIEGVFIGDQADFNFLDSVISEIGEVDIVIDDGSHVGSLTVLSFQHLFPKLKMNGLYCVEDTATFYSEHYSDKFESNGRSKVYNFFADLNYHIDIAGRGMTGNVQYALETENPNFDPVPKYSRMIKAAHIHPSLWIYEKR